MAQILRFLSDSRRAKDDQSYRTFFDIYSGFKILGIVSELVFLTLEMYYAQNLVKPETKLPENERTKYQFLNNSTIEGTQSDVDSYWVKDKIEDEELVWVKNQGRNGFGSDNLIVVLFLGLSIFAELYKLRTMCQTKPAKEPMNLYRKDEYKDMCCDNFSMSFLCNEHCPRNPIFGFFAQLLWLPIFFFGALGQMLINLVEIFLPPHLVIAHRYDWNCYAQLLVVLESIGLLFLSISFFSLGGSHLQIIFYFLLAATLIEFAMYLPLYAESNRSDIRGNKLIKNCFRCYRGRENEN